MIHHTTVDIDEIETEVLIEFSIVFNEVEIQKITDLETGVAICPDLEGQMTSVGFDSLYSELHEAGCNQLAERHIVNDSCNFENAFNQY